jgi:hypothetical protein
MYKGIMAQVLLFCAKALSENGNSLLPEKLRLRARIANLFFQRGTERFYMLFTAELPLGQPNDLPRTKAVESVLFPFITFPGQIT